ncbi:hypothetical protein P153DRAFT_415141 [Dothidotthia symphoricarpi CBS 119687]|uniref:Uncharacterized protein n=1 Tax=Dothidotthia symphoricarpi CBS 119687 TaxID=1392245 RepID=A0A6A6AKX9_9PLEO|nr:uncharacterized protein P153DRAFT_415141 [Dothidotthia symphoricarpi CBS 119687]KAF2131853.1 hypothetical protein P153DRAFT_415141 [Dothidotthia symphoricarpi CBS 119687]
MLPQLFVSSCLALASVSSAYMLPKRQTSDGIAITDFNKNATSTSGIGNVAAAGTLAPFGEVGVGCGINWASNVSYGGGLQAGSDVFGLGGGYTIKPDSLELGAGIGVNSVNASANIQFSGTKNGSFELTFESSSPIICTPGTQDGKFTVRCTSV